MASNLPVDVFNNYLIQNGNLNGNITGSVQQLSSVNSYAIQFVWSGATAPVGTFILSYSNDNINFTQDSTTSVPINTTDGSIMINVELPAYKYVIPNYLYTSGSGGSVSCLIHGKLV